MSLFTCGSMTVYTENDRYFSESSRCFMNSPPWPKAYLIRFEPNSDVGLIDEEPLDILLQCLEHRLASRNLAEPMFERTQACEHLRRLRAWLQQIAEIEVGKTVSRADQSKY